MPLGRPEKLAVPLLGAMEGAGSNLAPVGRPGQGKDRGDGGVGAAKQFGTVALDSTS